MMRLSRQLLLGLQKNWLVPVIIILFLYHRPQPPNSIYDQLYQRRLTQSIPTYPENFIVSACVLIRDASTILPEFLVRNYLSGVDHFYIYGDDNTHDELTRVQTVLTHFERIITYLPSGRLLPDDSEDTKTYVQMRIYRHCAATFGDTTRWMAFIDADEFFETDQLSSFQPRIRDRGRYAFLHHILKIHDNHPVLCIRWRSVLTNGRVMPPPRHVPLSDAFSIPCALRVNNTMKLSLRKTILKPAYLDFVKTPSVDVALHKGFRLKPPYHRFHCVWGPGSKISPPVYLAHYWSRSLYDYVQKIARGRPRSGVPSRTLSDLIEREKVCIPDLSSIIDLERRKMIRRYSTIFETVEQPSLSSSAVEQLLQVQQSNNDSTLCSGRVVTLLRHMVDGFTISRDEYCKQVGTSPTCSSGDEYQSLLWMEYIQQCDSELDSDKIFVKSFP